ncbi:TonB-dependent receptor [Rhizorhabdus wittichii]|uniref:TonB-dependent receptor n=1 Tax=Rhizorhabdus wittichii TaxID=160791 RepID=A0A975D4Z5_9SPHN|nr:TonB-dependent receptor [Rhizorhabdus wittichii]QTH23210.1 TonB-dependent receptor [Rhizorhabdus wittichii]
MTPASPVLARTIAGACAALLATTGIASTAFAQTGEAGASRTIEEIVVTARKREESLQTVPVAVSAFGAAQLQRYNISDLTKLGQMTPQLFVSESATGNNGSLSIRGIGSSSTSSGFDQAVSIVLDGLQYDKGDILAQGYFDLARVEVLKGPQALFFGKNNSAGVVSLTSADPTSKTELIGRYGHEFKANENWYEGIVSGPITDTLLGRLALRYNTLRGFIRNTAGATIEPTTGETVPPPRRRNWPDKKEFLGRLTLKYAPSDALALKLKVGGAHSDTAGGSQGLEPFSCAALGRSQVDPGEDCRADWRIRQNDVPPSIAAVEPTLNEEGGRLFNKYRAVNAVLTTTYDMQALGIPAQLTSVTGYAKFKRRALYDPDFTQASLFFGTEDVKNRSISQELRILTALDGPLNAMVGGFYQDTHYSYSSPDLRLVPLPADPVTGRYATIARSSVTDGYTASAFGQLIWKLTDTVEFTGGARYSHVVKDSYLVNDYFHSFTAPLWRPVGDKLVGDFSDDDISPEATLTWRPKWRDDADLAIYGAYKEGFKAGGFSNNGLASASQTAAGLLFDSERVSGFEVGIKSTWLDRTLRMNAVAYSYKFRDLQVNFFDSATLAYNLQNAAEATTKGAELEVEWLPPIEGLNLHGTLSYNRARYGNFISYCYTGQSLAAGCNLGDDGKPTAGVGTRQDLSGTPTPLAPRWTASGGFNYEQGIGGGLRFALSADANYTDHYLFSQFGRPDIVQKSFWRLDAGLRLFEEGSWWELKLIGRNLTNKYFYSITSVDSPQTGSGTGTANAVLADQVGVANRPREIAIEVVARF